MIQGYLHKTYMDSLFQLGEPVALNNCQGWLLRRSIFDSEFADLAGPYPLFCCKDPERLSLDLESLDSQLISVVCVMDPIGDFNTDLLNKTFNGPVNPFKEHFITDLQQLPEQFVSEHHRYYSKKSLKEITVEVCPNPFVLLDDWCALYQHLIQRHQITGIAAFSRKAFELQFSVPGLHVLKAGKDGKTIAMQLWYEMGDRAYYHLNASNADGYRHNASYGMMWTAMRYFQARGIHWLNLGSGAGLNDGRNGLTDFKKGWSTGKLQAWLCGKIINPDLYSRLCEETRPADRAYFPAYRAPGTAAALKGAA